MADVRYGLGLADAWVPLGLAALMATMGVLAWRGRLRWLLGG